MFLRLSSLWLPTPKSITQLIFQQGCDLGRDWDANQDSNPDSDLDLGPEHPTCWPIIHENLNRHDLDHTPSQSIEVVPRMTELFTLPWGRCPLDPPNIRGGRCPLDSPHSRGRRSPTFVHLGNCVPQTDCTLEAAAPNPCTWGLRAQIPAVAPLLDYNDSSFDIRR